MNYNSPFESNDAGPNYTNNIGELSTRSTMRRRNCSMSTGLGVTANHKVLVSFNLTGTGESMGSASLASCNSIEKLAIEFTKKVIPQALRILMYVTEVPLACIHYCKLITKGEREPFIQVHHGPPEITHSRIHQLLFFLGAKGCDNSPEQKQTKGFIVEHVFIL